MASPGRACGLRVLLEQTEQEHIIWSTTSLILLPTIQNRLNTLLPELFRLLASLQDLRAGAHIESARVAQHYVAPHGVFHDAPEIAVGNWVLSLAAELISPECAIISERMTRWEVLWKPGLHNCDKHRPVPQLESRACGRTSCDYASYTPRHCGTPAAGSATVRLHELAARKNT